MFPQLLDQAGPGHRTAHAEQARCQSGISGDNGEPGHNDPGMALDLTGVDLLTQTVATPRLLLRPWKLADINDIARACQDPLIQQWLAALPSPYTPDDARTFVTDMAWRTARERTSLLLAVTGRPTGGLLGSIGLKGLGDSRGAEIGYWVAPWARGRGYAAESTDALTRWAFEHGLHRVQLLAATGNVASQRAAERAEFTREGVVRASQHDRDGAPMNMVRFGRLATDAAPTLPLRP